MIKIAATVLALLCLGGLCEGAELQNSLDLGVMEGLVPDGANRGLGDFRLDHNGIELSYERTLTPRTHLELQAQFESDQNSNANNQKFGIDLGLRHYFFRQERFAGPYIGYFFEAAYNRASNPFFAYEDLSEEDTQLYGFGLESGYQWRLPNKILLALGSAYRLTESPDHGLGNDPYYSSSLSASYKFKISLGRSF